MIDVAYYDHFNLADDYINHLDTLMGSISDPFVKSRYTGFVAISAVTVYELAIKTIFLEFAGRKHKVLKNFTSAYFERINGRIKVKVIRDDYISKFGDKYVVKFDRLIKQKEYDVLRSAGASISSSYGNIIEWRNQFAHEGIIPTTPTYDEVKKSYQFGKSIIDCLDEAMKR